MTELSDPAYIGPGKWDTLHREAYEATTFQKQQDFCKFVRRMQETFPCVKCKKHFKQYLDDNPPEKSLGLNVDGKPLGMFQWTWNFHNAVNSRLHKRILDWNTAIGLYDPELSIGICSSGCNQTESNVIAKVIPRSNNRSLLLKK